MSERAADIFSKNYLRTCTDFFNAMKKKRQQIKKGGGIYTFTLSRGDNSVPFQSTALFTLGFTEYFI